jgi:hypothetical protein
MRRCAEVVLAGCIGLSLAIVVANVNVTPAKASHATWDWRHLGHVHTSFDDEDYCAETSRTTRSFSNLISNINHALYIDPPSDQKWDATSFDDVNGGWRIWLVPHQSAPCQNLSPSERGPIEIEYTLADDNSYVCQTTKCNISIASTQYIDQMGHSAAQFYYVYLYAPRVNGEEIPGYYNHMVNHETGHTLGLADGDGTCPDSIMHSSTYGCLSDRTYPSAGDKAGAANRAVQ